MDLNLTNRFERFQKWLFNESVESPTLGTEEERALQTLGISVEEYEETLRRRTMSKLDQSLKLATQLDDSFGSFLSIANHGYQKWRAVQKGGWKRWGERGVLRAIRRIVSKHELEQEDITLVVIYAYLLHRIRNKRS